MQTESAISLLNQMPETKSEIERFSRLVLEQIDMGEMRDVLTFAARFKALAKLEETLFGNVLFKDAVLEAAEKYGGKPFEHGNAKFSIRETGVKYDYASCGDTEWEQLDSSMKMIAERKSARETFLKSLTPEMTVFGEDGVQIMQPHKTSTTSVTITLK